MHGILVLVQRQRCSWRIDLTWSPVSVSNWIHLLPLHLVLLLLQIGFGLLQPLLLWLQVMAQMPHLEFRNPNTTKILEKS